MISKGFLFKHLVVGFQCQTALCEDKVVYINDFEGHDLTAIEGKTVLAFGSISVLSNYNNNGFSFKMDDLARHELLAISFDFYLYYSGDEDGNTSEPDGPDFWCMKLDGISMIEVTFSNNPCACTYCLYQPFPEEFSSFSNPRTSSSASLPGLCHLADLPHGTTLYQISKTVAHTDSKVSFTFENRLVQTNTDNPTCDESWSIGRIKIKAFSLN